MSNSHPGFGLCGRRHECRALDRALEGLRSEEQSSVLVLRGESGVGKTALLDYVLERASGCRIARAAGVESEMELPFAGLQQLCQPMLDRLEHLPEPQRDALRLAFGLAGGPVPDRFLVGLAVLSLLSYVAEERPLVCLIDDAQWLDRASVQSLAFVARRLMAEPVALVFGLREPSEERELVGLPALVVQGLDRHDSRRLLEWAVPGRLHEQVRDRIVVETGGNPLALLELPRGLTPAELAGGFTSAEASPISGRIEQTFLRRLQSLPDETQRLLLIAAAEPDGDPMLLWRAARELDIPDSAAAPAEDAGLLRIGARVSFRHPLVRSAMYGVANVEERRRVHRALADATDRELDPDRRAWHRAQGASSPDEEVAAELERSADRAQGRGGLAAAAAFLERAVELTPDHSERARRAVAAGQAKMASGAPDEALALLSIADRGPLDELHRAHIDLVRAQVAFAVNRGRDAPPLLLKAAKRLEPLDAKVCRDTYLEAIFAALFAGRLGDAGGVREAALAARSAPPAPYPPRAADLLLDGYALTITDGYAVGAPILQRAVRAFLGEHTTADEVLRYAFLASYAAQATWDEEGYRALPTRQIQLGRGAGALSVLPLTITMRIGAHLHAGELATSASLLGELHDVTEATGAEIPPYAALALAVWKGREAEAAALMEASMQAVIARGEGIGVTFIEWLTAVLYNGLGRYPEAFAAATRANDYPEELQSPLWLHELVEAAVRSGRLEEAAVALEELSRMTAIIGTEWALGIEARSRALLSDGDEAARLYRKAIDHLVQTEARVELARAHLLYGEWLRRQNLRVEAREQLRASHGMLVAIGAAAFAARAAGELAATGESVRRYAVQTSGELTPQEAQVARLARDGLSNPEIGARLFISPRTVQYHLRKVFAKLGITSRTQLELDLPATQESYRCPPSITSLRAEPGPAATADRSSAKPAVPPIAGTQSAIA
jgi:DNA-binding CsgD family transcriptional regulator/tetratricopeptide (TPR) repeat protein